MPRPHSRRVPTRRTLANRTRRRIGRTRVVFLPISDLASNVVPAWVAHREGSAPVVYEITRKRRMKEVFNELLQEWQQETWFMSSVKNRILHPAYLSIIGLGPAAVPLILRELQRTADHWFSALQAITRLDPAPPDADFEGMRDSWLAWGKEHDYLT